MSVFGAPNSLDTSANRKMPWLSVGLGTGYHAGVSDDFDPARRRRLNPATFAVLVAVACFTACFDFDRAYQTYCGDKSCDAGSPDVPAPPDGGPLPGGDGGPSDGGASDGGATDAGPSEPCDAS